MKGRSPVGVGLLGLGVVGSGVAGVLLEKRDHIARQVGAPVALRRVLVKHPQKPRPPEVPAGLITTDADEVLNDEQIDIVVEVMGGDVPALDYIMKAVSLGKHVVTANKEVMAKQGSDILSLAGKKGVMVLFEASVGGGIPIIGPLMKELLANDIVSLRAIINGTTNYILTRMSRDGLDSGEALEEAKALGYAEADPTNDVEGLDAAYKLAILSSLAFHSRVKCSDIYREGISRLTSRDFRYARELGYCIKLLAIGRQQNGRLQLRVHPALVPLDVLMASVDGVVNAVEVEGDLAGRVFFQGQGAGSAATTSAVVADILEIARNVVNGVRAPYETAPQDDKVIEPISELVTKYYLRLVVPDHPGVLAQIASVFAGLQISIASVIQKETDEDGGAAELVMMTHNAKEASMQQALKGLQGLEVVEEIGNLIRVEEWK